MAIGRVKRTGGGWLWDVVGRVTPDKVRNPDLPAAQYFNEAIVVRLLIAWLVVPIMPFALVIILILKSILVILAAGLFVLPCRLMLSVCPGFACWCNPGLLAAAIPNAPLYEVFMCEVLSNR
jgi:hypothetical protein